MKLYSATVAFFTSSGSSFSLLIPAAPTNTMPIKETSTPPSDTSPADVCSKGANSPFSTGGTIVPAAEHKPQPIANPSPTPR